MLQKCQAESSGLRSDGKSLEDILHAYKWRRPYVIEVHRADHTEPAISMERVYSLPEITSSPDLPTVQELRTWLSGRTYVFQEGLSQKSRHYLSIPDMDTLVKGSTGQILPVRTERYTIDRLLMLGQCVDANTSLHIPQSNRRVK